MAILIPWKTFLALKLLLVIALKKHRFQTHPGNQCSKNSPEIANLIFWGQCPNSPAPPVTGSVDHHVY